MRVAPETPARPRPPARAHRAGRGCCGAVVVGSRARVGHAAARCVLDGDERGRSTDTEPSSPPPRRLAAGRAGCRGRARRRSCSGMGSACGGAGLAPRPTGGVRRDRSWLPTAPLAVGVLLLFPTGRLLARRWSLVLVLSVVGVLAAEPGWVLNPDAGSEYVAGRNPYAVGPAADPRDVRRRVRDHGGVAAPRAGCGPAPVPDLDGRRATAAEVVRPRQRGPRRGAASRGRVVVGRAGGARHPGSGGHALADRHLCRDPALRLYDVDLVISRTFSYATLSPPGSGLCRCRGRPRRGRRSRLGLGDRRGNTARRRGLQARSTVACRTWWTGASVPSASTR